MNFKQPLILKYKFTYLKNKLLILFNGQTKWLLIALKAYL